MFKPIYELNTQHVNELLKTSPPENHRVKDFWQSIHQNRNIDINFEKYLMYGLTNSMFYNPKACNYIKKLIIKGRLQPCLWDVISSGFSDSQFLENYVEHLNFNRLSGNPNAIQLLEKYLEKINYLWLLMNRNAIHLLKDKDIDELLKSKDNSSLFYTHRFFENINASELIEKYLEKIINEGRIAEISNFQKYILSRHPHLISFLEKYPQLIDWKGLSKNPNAIHFLEKNLDKVDWRSLSENPNAIRILEKNLDKVYWGSLSENPNAIHILEQHTEKINFWFLCQNSNAVHIIKKHFHKIPKSELEMLSSNTNEDAIELIRENIQYVSTYYLGQNPNVLKIVGTLDYDAMKIKCQPFAQELATYVLNPTRLLRLCESYGLDLEEYMEIIGD